MSVFCVCAAVKTFIYFLLLNQHEAMRLIEQKCAFILLFVIKILSFDQDRVPEQEFVCSLGAPVSPTTITTAGLPWKSDSESPG